MHSAIDSRLKQESYSPKFDNEFSPASCNVIQSFAQADSVVDGSYASQARRCKRLPNPGFSRRIQKMTSVSLQLFSLCAAVLLCLLYQRERRPTHLICRTPTRRSLMSFTPLIRYSSWLVRMCKR